MIQGHAIMIFTIMTIVFVSITVSHESIDNST